MKIRITFLIIIAIAVFLRVYKLSSNPPSLYWDEASLGYNAYAVYTTGYDEHGEKYPLARFIAFGDYKPPGYIYSAAPAIASLGLNEFAVRLPSALAGIFMTYISYLITRLLFKPVKIALLAALIFSISPWSIHLSRVAFEANLAAAFNLAAIYFFLKSISLGGFLPVSMLFFLASFYTFNANRIIAPLIYIFLSLYFFKSSVKNLKWQLISAGLAIIFLIPSMGFLMSRESRLRFQEVSIFNNLQPVLTANSRIALDGNTLISKIIHNRRILFPFDFLKHYTDNFSGRFLFTHGDVNPRLHVQGMGQLYFIELPFFIIGIIYLLIKNRNTALLLFIWMMIAVIPAGAARETPHALRIVSILPTYQIIIALGLNQIFQWIQIKKKQKFYLLINFAYCLLFIANMVYYLHLYHIHFPRDWSGEFQYGTKQMVEFVNARQHLYDKIFVDPSVGRPYIFFAFHMPIPTDKLLISREASRDWYGFWQVNSIANIEFNLHNVSSYQGKSLLVSSEKNLPENYRLLKIIRNLTADPVFYIAEKI